MTAQLSSAGTRPESELEAGTLVVGDLHLDLEQPAAVEAFRRWLEGLAGVPRLVILGDLFEYWFGSAQARSAGGQSALEALAALRAQGTAIDLIPGNRDFLLGAAFERESGVRLFPTGFVGLLPGGARCLFVHGDELCTLDVGYLRLRRVLRSGPVAALAGALPAGVGNAIARRLRRASGRALESKPQAAAQQQPAAVLELTRAAHAEVLVCGHAHEFRDERLPAGKAERGPRWIVVDAFGGDRDTLRVDVAGELHAGASGADSSAFSAEPYAPSADPCAPSADPRAPSADPCAPSADPRAPSADPGATHDDPAPAAALPAVSRGASGAYPAPAMTPRDSRTPERSAVIIAIDGPAGAGKSTVARLVAARLGLRFLDTGAMYRAVTLAALREGLDPDDAEGVGELAARLRLSFDDRGLLSIDGEPAEPAIRSAEVDAQVSEVSAHGSVRRSIVAEQQRMGAELGGVVAEGRDTTTAVFPEADLKVYLAASPEERARRRAVQMGDPQLAGEVLRQILRRDAFDMGREHSPLIEAPDALRIDADSGTAEEVAERIIALAAERGLVD